MRLLSIICSLCIIYGCQKKNNIRIFLVPKDYEGALLIIEDETADKSITLMGDTMLFDFTKSTILKFKGKFIEYNSLLDNLKYYYVDKTGNKIEIPIAIGSFTKMDSNKVYVHLKHTQISENVQCDLISTPKNFNYYLQQQNLLCDSLMSKRP